METPSGRLAAGVNVSARCLQPPSSSNLGNRRVEGGEEFVGVTLSED